MTQLLVKSIHRILNWTDRVLLFPRWILECWKAVPPNTFYCLNVDWPPGALTSWQKIPFRFSESTILLAFLTISPPNDLRFPLSVPSMSLWTVRESCGWGCCLAFGHVSTLYFICASFKQADVCPITSTLHRLPVQLLHSLPGQMFSWLFSLPAFQTESSLRCLQPLTKSEQGIFFQSQ